MPAARELGAIGVRVNAIAPGLFLTPMVAALDEKVLESLKSQMEAPRRLGDMREFAHCCAFIIENAYVKDAHRAFIFKSHSGSYGEVNSEEGYQNLRRFLFGRWAVSAALMGAVLEQNPAFSWQLDMRLSIRGLSVVMSEQTTEDWCPITLTAPAGQPDPLAQPGGLPLTGTFLLDPRESSSSRF